MWGYSCSLWRNSGHSSQPGKGDILVVSVVWNVQVLSVQPWLWSGLVWYWCSVKLCLTGEHQDLGPGRLSDVGAAFLLFGGHICCQQCHQILVNVHGERGQHCPWVPWPWLALPLIILSLFSSLQDTASALIIDKPFIKHIGSSQVFSSTLEDGLCCQYSSWTLMNCHNHGHSLLEAFSFV